MAANFIIEGRMRPLVVYRCSISWIIHGHY